MNLQQTAEEVGALSSEEVARRVGIHWKTLMRLVDAGVLHPRRLEGGRKPAAWSDDDLQEAYVATNLRRSGVPVARVGRVLDMLRSSTEEPYSGRWDLLLYDAGEDTEDSGTLLPRPEWGQRLEEIRAEGEQRGAASYTIAPLEMPYTVRTGLPLRLPPDAPRPGISTVEPKREPETAAEAFYAAA